VRTFGYQSTNLDLTKAGGKHGICGNFGGEVERAEFTNTRGTRIVMDERSHKNLEGV